MAPVPVQEGWLIAHDLPRPFLCTIIVGAFSIRCKVGVRKLIFDVIAQKLLALLTRPACYHSIN